MKCPTSRNYKARNEKLEVETEKSEQRTLKLEVKTKEPGVGSTNLDIRAKNHEEVITKRLETGTKKLEVYGQRTV